ncbi:MAG: hypothetical protein BMS9Abin37_0078 [Acidobacteriota bacterium]|nr:MAG: hypothetical protein BMS9Abin37_0078 [Acidobacteriota bacterium]
MKLPKVVVLLGVMLVLVTGTELRAQEWTKFELIETSALPIVRAKVNGMGGHRLVLDVGFKDLLLDTLLVDGAGMKLVSRGEVQQIDFYGKKELVPVSYVDTLEIGKAKFELVRTLLIEGEDGTGSGGLRSYGRIGRDILEPLRLTIHYPRQLLLIEPSPEDDVPTGGVTYTAEGRFLYVPVRLEKEGGYEDATFVLDPGTSGTAVDRKWAVHTKLANKKAHRPISLSSRLVDFDESKYRCCLPTCTRYPTMAIPPGSSAPTCCALFP